MGWDIWDIAFSINVTSDGGYIVSGMTGLYQQFNVFLMKLGSENISLEISFLEDWNLVGLPLETEDFYYTSIFPDAIEMTLFSYDNGYLLESSLSVGTGYWLRFNVVGSTTILGTPINGVSISLDEGWNLISGITISLDITEIQDPGEIIIAGTFYGFSSDGYLNTENIEPGEGYWVRASASGSITIIEN